MAEDEEVVVDMAMGAGLNAAGLQQIIQNNPEMVNQLQQLQQGLINPQQPGGPALNMNPRRIQEVILNDDVLQQFAAALPVGAAGAAPQQNGGNGNNDENGLNILPQAQQDNDNDDQNMDEDMH
jgi:hypothetical protein